MLLSVSKNRKAGLLDGGSFSTLSCLAVKVHTKAPTRPGGRFVSACR